MKTLNLTDLNKSDIKYKISKFPDGQQNIVILSNNRDTFSHIEANDSIEIKSRLNNWLDLELIICAVASLRELGVEEIHLYVPYIMGARSDRKFEEGGNNYLRDVICPIINSLNFKTVTCIDPHSDVLEACIKGFKKESNLQLVKFAFNDIFNLICGETAYLKQDKFILVSPDAGASKKIYKLAEEIGYKGDIIVCSKDRDENGKLTKIEVPLTMYDNKPDLIIIDDICDGGATFINIAKAIEEHEWEYGKKYLIVTHGIFSKGYTELSKYFDGIYCTNSYKDIEIFPTVACTLKLPNGINFVKQLNVF